MKYTIMGFSQQGIVDLISSGHKIDVADLLILRWLVDFSHTDKMAKVVDGGKTYYWVSYKSVLDDLPILNIGRRMLAVRLQRMADAGILCSSLKKNGGTFTLYGFGPKYESLLSKPVKECCNPDVGGCKNIVTPSDNLLSPPLQKNLQPKDSSTNNPSTKNQNNGSAVAPPDFVRFWKAYPLKKAKQAALKAWKKINPDKQFAETIISAVEKQKRWEDWIRDNGQYIPNPATWLNQGRWEDEERRKAKPDDGPERLITSEEAHRNLERAKRDADMRRMEGGQ